MYYLIHTHCQKIILLMKIMISISSLSTPCSYGELIWVKSGLYRKMKNQLEISWNKVEFYDGFELCAPYNIYALYANKFG